MTTALYRRLRAQCCPISGLTPTELDEHVRGVEYVVNLSRTKTRPVGTTRQSSANRPDKEGR